METRFYNFLKIEIVLWKHDFKKNAFQKKKIYRLAATYVKIVSSRHDFNC